MTNSFYDLSVRSVIVRAMRPSAQIMAAMELLETLSTEKRPADRVLSAYFRVRRYIGSKDKASISEAVYSVLRQKGTYSWLAQQANLSDSPRSWMMLHLLSKQQDPDEYFTGDEYAPEIMSDTEAMYLVIASKLMQEQAINKAPEWARLNLPEWLLPKMQQSLGENFEPELLAMQDRADLC